LELACSIVHSRTENLSNPAQVSDNYGAGFYARRYKSLGAGFSLFGEGNFTGIYSHQKNYYVAGNIDYTDIKGYTLSLGFYPGIA
jgi:hypothetical protein